MRSLAILSFTLLSLSASLALEYSVSWVGNSFSGADDKWVQNFFIHTGVQPDGTVNTWSHWDEGGKKFGVYKDGDVIGNTNVSPNSLETRDQHGHLWKLKVDYTDPKHQEWEFVPKEITCDGEVVTFAELYQPMAIAMANDGTLMFASNLTNIFRFDGEVAVPSGLILKSHIPHPSADFRH